jgi:hypothetical protein
MIPSIQRKIAALVISLVIQVISLTVVAGAATFPTPLNTLPSVTSGVLAPTRIAVDSATGTFYVTDTRAGGVLVYSKYGAYLKTILTAASPRGVAFFNNKIVVTQVNFAAVYDVTTGSQLFTFGTGTLVNADGVAVDSAGYFWIMDTAGGVLRCFNASGVQVNSYSGVGFVMTDLKIVHTTDGTDRLAMVDMLKAYAQVYKTSGSSLVAPAEKIFGVATTFPNAAAGGTLTAPMGIAFEKSADGSAVSRVYITDAYQSTVSVYDYATGSSTNGVVGYLGTMGGYGSVDGKLMIPLGLEFSVVGTNKLLLVANGYGNVTAYGIDGGTWPIGTLPVVTVANPNPDTTTATTYTLTGTVTSNSTTPTVRVALNGGAVQSATVTGSASPWTWSITLTGYGFGSNNYTVTPRNDVGDGLTLTGSFTYNDVNGATIDPSVPGYTNQTSILVTGTMATGASVTVTNGTTGLSYPAAQVDANHWSCLVPLTNGANSITATATKPNAAPVTTPPKTIILDTVPPVLAVSMISTGSATSTQLLNVSGTASDDLGTVAVTVNGVAAALYNGVFSAPVVLANGTNTIVVAATDLAGNVTTSTRIVTFDFDPTRPVVTVTQPADVLDTDVASVTVSGSVTNAASLTVAGTAVSIDGSNNWTTSVPVALTPGMNTIEIVATSLAGKTSSVKRTVFYTPGKPALALTTPGQDFASKLPSMDVTGTVGSGAAGVKCTFNGVTTTPAVTAGTFRCNLAFPLAGSFPLTVAAVDASNNVLSSLTRDFVYDNTPPLLTVDRTVFGAPVTVTGTVDAGGLVNVQAWNSTTLLGKATVNNAGTYSIDLTGVTYDPNALMICGVDVAGNTTCPFYQDIPRDCDFNGDGVTTIMDALLIQRAVAYAEAVTPTQLAHADVGPLRLGKQNPNGVLDMSDAVLCMQKALGTAQW